MDMVTAAIAILSSSLPEPVPTVMCMQPSDIVRGWLAAWIKLETVTSAVARAAKSAGLLAALLVVGLAGLEEVRFDSLLGEQARNGLEHGLEWMAFK